MKVKPALRRLFFIGYIKEPISKDGHMSTEQIRFYVVYQDRDGIYRAIDPAAKSEEEIDHFLEGKMKEGTEWAGATATSPEDAIEKIRTLREKQTPSHAARPEPI
jgi:hypothetical protein